MTNLERFLKAGGIGDASATDAGETKPDRLDAKRYSHPVLGDRQVVRLCPGQLAAGMDAEMQVLGFSRLESEEGVGIVLRRAAGFPGWVLLKDPDHARAALDTAFAMRKSARLIPTKPGLARDAFIELANQLGKTLPHFLPSFWEECGRLFLEFNHRGMASTSFEKAREAQRRYNLEIDAEVLLDVFLEFALQGALAAKSLSAYAKNLLESADPHEAVGLFRSLCVGRTLGGLAPTEGMLKELRALCKRAGLDVAAGERSFLEEILFAPSLGRAPAGFWKSATETLQDILKDHEAAAWTLLFLFPKPPQDSKGFEKEWLSMLRKSGMIDQLKATSAPGKPAAWISGLVRWSSVVAPVIELLEAFHPRLVGDGQALQWADPEDYWPSLDLLLAEECLRQGIPLAAPTDGDLRLELTGWTRLGQKAPDPVFVAGNPVFSIGLERAVKNAMGEEDFELAAAFKPSLREIRLRVLLEALRGSGPAGIVHLKNAVGELSEKAGPSVWREFPELVAAVQALDPAEILQRTLSAGLLEELHWPSFERVHAELKGAAGKKNTVEWSGVFPYLVVYNQRTAVVLGPEGEVFRYDYTLPKGSDIRAFRYSGGRLLVLFHDDDYNGKGFWSHAPKTVFEVDNPYVFTRTGGVSVLIDGLLCEGGRVYSPGDSSFSPPSELFSDGVACWTTKSDSEGHDRPVPLDCRQGKTSVGAGPAFFEGWTDRLSDQVLVPVPGLRHETPLGVSGGLYGLRMKSPSGAESGPLVVEDLAGGRLELSTRDVEAVDATPRGLLRLPGGAEPLLLSEDWDDQLRTWRQGGGGVWCVQEQSGRNGSNGLPWLYFHFFEPRDEAFSRALRQLDPGTASRLVSAYSPELEKTPGALASALGPLLPACVDPLLVEGVAGQVAACMNAVTGLRKLAGDQEKGAVDDPETLTERDLLRALGAQWIGRGWAYQTPFSRTLLAGLEAFGTEGPVFALEELNLQWMKWVGRESALVALPRSASFRGAGEKNRLRLARLMRLLAKLPWTRRPEDFLLQKLEILSDTCPFLALQKADPDEDDEDEPQVASVESSWIFHHEGRSFWVVRDSDEDTRPVTATAVVSGGAGAGPPPGVKVLESAPLPAQPTSEWLLAAAEAVCEAQEFSFPSDEGLVALCGVTGLSTLEAAWLAAGLATPRFEDEVGEDNGDDDFDDDDSGQSAGDFLKDRLRCKKGELELARQTLSEWSLETVWAVADFAVRRVNGNPGASMESYFAALGEAFVAICGRHSPLPLESVAAVEKLIHPELDARALVKCALAPKRPGYFSTDGKWKADRWGGVEILDGSPEECFNAEAAVDLARLVCAASAYLPVGDPVRANLAELVEAAKQRLTAGSLIFSLGEWYASKKSRRIATYFEALPQHPWLPDEEGGEPDPKVRGTDADGLLVFDDEGESLSFWFCPARYDAVRNFRTLLEITKLTGDGSAAVLLQALNFLQSERCGAFLERLRSTPVPAGGFEACPLQSAPGTVAEAARHLSLSEAAAVLYLQILALPQPSKALVCTWNRWKPAVYDKAAAELVGKSLVTTGKRPRAGREIFLPGGWVEFSSPDFPLESWKLPLLGSLPDEDGKPAFPLGLILPLVPVHELFRLALDRVTSGDSPQLETVKPRRKK